MVKERREGVVGVGEGWGGGRCNKSLKGTANDP